MAGGVERPSRGEAQPCLMAAGSKIRVYWQSGMCLPSGRREAVVRVLAKVVLTGRRFFQFGAHGAEVVSCRNDGK